MSSRILTNQAVVALDDGKYVLFGESYDSNVWPHTPYWTPLKYGTGVDIQEYACRFASEAEGGMLQIRSGWTKPEVIFNRVMRALAEPVKDSGWIFPTVVASTRFCVRTEVPDNTAAGMGLEAMLRETGHPGAADQLYSGWPVGLIYKHHGEVIRRLLAAGVREWDLFTFDKLNRKRHPELGFKPKFKEKFKPKYRVFEVFPLESEVGKFLLLAIDNQPPVITGQEYWTMEHFIEEFARPKELVEPGSFGPTMKEFRTACETAPALPDEVELCFKLPEGNHGTFDDLVVALGKPMLTDLKVTVGELRAHQNDRRTIWPFRSGIFNRMLDWIKLPGEIMELTEANQTPQLALI
jgi:hypothetical protein